MMEDFTIVDTGVRFKGHPVLLGSTKSGRKADKLVLTRLDRFLKRHLPEDIIESIEDPATGTIVKGAL